MSGPCGWTIAPTCPEWAAATAPQRADAEAMAVQVLWMLSGRVFGVCEQTVRPCFQAPDRSSTYRGSGGTGRVGSWWPGLINGSFYDGACGCSNNCSCVGPAEVALPGPVASVTEVRIDGVVLAPAAYRIRNSRWLLRIDGEQWPQAQDLTAADDEPGAFVITYGQGIPVPEAGLIAAADLACDLLRAKVGGRCKIPERAQSVARQGVTIEMVDPVVMFEQGLTGIPSVDQWIVAVNPSRARGVSQVYSVDAPRVSRIR